MKEKLSKTEDPHEENRAVTLINEVQKRGGFYKEELVQNPEIKLTDVKKEFVEPAKVEVKKTTESIKEDNKKIEKEAEDSWKACNDPMALEFIRRMKESNKKSPTVKTDESKTKAKEEGEKSGDKSDEKSTEEKTKDEKAADKTTKDMPDLKATAKTTSIAETKADTETKSDAQTKADAQSRSDAQPKSDAQSKSDAQPKSDDKQETTQKDAWMGTHLFCDRGFEYDLELLIVI